MMNLRILAVAILFLGLAGIAQAYIFEISHQCAESCIQGTEASFNITIDPGKWKDSMELKMIQLLDARKGTVIATYNKTAMVSTIRSFYFSGKLPEFYGSALINVSTCFTTGVPTNDRMVDENFIATELSYCEKSNHTMPLLQCVYPASCDGDSTCINGTCMKLECGKCQHILDHKCRPYQCCSDYACKQDQNCINNSCIGFSCADNEAALNHTCTMINCASDQKALNHTCQAIIRTPVIETKSNVTRPPASPGFIKRMAELPAKFTMDFLYRVLEVIALGAILFFMLKLIEAKTKIFIKLANRGKK
jgi:hypothetical protein